MINIISRSIVEGGINGPQKVVSNLIKGLDIIGYPYCLNKDLNATSQLWIHDDHKALKEASDRKIKAIVGPNLYVLPRNIPDNIDFSNFTYLQPSKWAADVWSYYGFNKCEFEYWPAGIDTNEFSKRPKPTDGIVLIYFKQRYPEELDHVKMVLEKNKIKYDIISYGYYNQKDYFKKLNDTKYIIWLGRQESQGIALEEALSMNVPILVWDVSSIGHWVPTKKEEKTYTPEESSYPHATSAYYFDEKCGILTKEKEKIEVAIYKMEEKWKSFEPRNYVLENLSLEKQASDLIKIFYKHYGISYESGLNEKLSNNKNWINAKFYYKIYFWIKKMAKKMIFLLKKLLRQ